MQKKCTKCQAMKDTTEFHKNSTRKDGLQTKCKGCNTAVTISKYKNDPEFRLQTAMKAKQRLDALKQEVNQIKGETGCSKCEESDYRCLDFHHVDPTTKSSSVSNLLSIKNRSRILDEIKKCVVLCANCHRKEHS